jgi:hypothetical protein
MTGRKEFWSVLMTIVWLVALPAIGLSAMETAFTKGGQSFKYVWGQFLDAQVVQVVGGQGAQIYALRSGVLRQKAGSEFVELRRIIGLWQAPLDPTGMVGKAELVQDVSTHVFETYNLDVVRPATWNAKMLSACADSAGQVHLFLTVSVISPEGRLQNRLLYLRRKGKGWKEMLTGPLGDYPASLTSFVAGNDVHFFFLQGLKQADVPIVQHSLPINQKMKTQQWRLFGAPNAQPLQAGIFTAFAIGGNPVVIYRVEADSAFTVARWDDSRRSWDIRKDVLNPRIDNAAVGGLLRGLSGFSADGTLHVFGAFRFNQQRQIVHLSCAGGDDRWDSEVVLNQGADWVSAVAGTAGQTDLIGVNQSGAVWHARRQAPGAWRFDGIILDENTK